MKTGLKTALLTTLVLGIAEGLIPWLLIKNGLAAWPPALNLFSVLGVFFILLGSSHPDLGGLGVREIR